MCSFHWNRFTLLSLVLWLSFSSTYKYQREYWKREKTNIKALWCEMLRATIFLSTFFGFLYNSTLFLARNFSMRRECLCTLYNFIYLWILTHLPHRILHSPIFSFLFSFSNISARIHTSTVVVAIVLSECIYKYNSVVYLARSWKFCRKQIAVCVCAACIMQSLKLWWKSDLVYSYFTTVFFFVLFLQSQKEKSNKNHT